MSVFVILGLCVFVLCLFVVVFHLHIFILCGFVIILGLKIVSMKPKFSITFRLQMRLSVFNELLYPQLYYEGPAKRSTGLNFDCLILNITLTSWAHEPA